MHKQLKGKWTRLDYFRIGKYQHLGERLCGVVEDVQYIEGRSALWSVFSILENAQCWGDKISPLKDVRYYGVYGVFSVLQGMFSTVGVFSIVEHAQYCGGWSLWRVLSTVKDVQYCGGCSVLWRNFSIVEDV